MLRGPDFISNALLILDPGACGVYREDKRGWWRAGSVWRRLDGGWDALDVTAVPTTARAFPEAHSPLGAAELVRGALLRAEFEPINTKPIPKGFEVVTPHAEWEVTPTTPEGKGVITREHPKRRRAFWEYRLVSYDGRLLPLVWASDDSEGIDFPSEFLTRLLDWAGAYQRERDGTRMSERLQRIRDVYLGGQPMSEFLALGGDAAEYARLVFAREIFGPGEDPADSELGILTAEDLTAALLELEQAEAQQ